MSINSDFSPDLALAHKTNPRNSFKGKIATKDFPPSKHQTDMNPSNNKAMGNFKNDSDRRICFDSNPDILTVDSHLDYTEHERSSAWYTPGECHCFREEYDRESSDKSIETFELERAQRIDEVRDLLLKAQDVQRSIRCNNDKKSDCDHDTENKSNAKWGSYSRWLADFYKHHSEECAIAARHRGLENFVMTNQKWCPQHHNHIHRFHHESEDHESEHSETESETEVASSRERSLDKPAKPCRWSDNESESETEVAFIRERSMDKPIKPCRWSDNDDSSCNNSETSEKTQQSPNRRCKQERWSANGTSANGAKDVPLKPLKKNITPPRLHTSHAA